MTLNTDISTALHLLEHVHERVEDCDDPKLQLHTSQDLQSLISLLEDPVFRSIVTIQDSLAELNTQLVQHPSILPGDFEINLGGQLQLSVPTTPVQPVGQGMYQNLYQDNSEVDDQRVPVAPLLHSSSEDTSAQVTSPSINSEVMGMPPIMTPTYAKEFQKVIETAARGRQIFTVQLFKPEGTSLGFSVVGLRSNDRDELGIFLQEIQPCGIAENDGRLVEGDQILAIDGQPLDSNISHEQAISILQKARGLVELIVARSAQDIPTDELSGATVASAAAGAGGAAGHTAPGQQEATTAASATTATTPDKDAAKPTTTVSSTTPAAAATTPSAAQGSVVERSNSAVSESSKSGDMVLNTEWAQVEVINLINDGSGLGFGIIGGRSTGVVVKTILPGGVADRDNRLQSGDHILQIGDVNLRGMGSEQVASVLRQSGTHVRLVVARPVEPTSPDYQALGSHAPIVPTKILGDPEELDRHLLRSGADAYNQRRDNGSIFGPDSDLDLLSRPSLIMDAARPPGSVPITDLPLLSMDPIDVNALPEMERFTVELKKDSCGLGITIAGYVCEKEELSGIFVKSISEGSAADLSGKIQINDRIVEVNGHSLQGYSNHEAVEVLRSTGQTVKLCLERYLRGPKYEQLQQAIAASELRMPQPGSPSITSLPTFPISADGDTTLEIEPEGESHTTVDSGVLQEIDRDALMANSDEITNIEALLSDPSTQLTPKIEAAIKAKWQKIVGPEIEIVVAQLKKFKEGSGLGISLEGTVDVENGQEVRPHHYIRSILPDGPVGKNAILRSGDELLEVNGYRLLGINHMEVVAVLKELPVHVRMVCGRSVGSDPLCPIDTAQHQAAFQTRSILGGSLQNLLPSTDRLVKAKSDGSLASTTTTATVTDASLNKMKSRSLEPLTGLAMWSSEPQIIQLVKGERGLGFSILDYQDPMNPNETVIVIRSLVPGGVAQVDGQLIPGDRLLFVNDIALENATLDQAVQALKGAPKGVVRIGVAKPLPIPDSIAQRLTQGGVVRRSKSLPDSDATDHAAAAADLNDFLSSRSGTSVGGAGGSERARAIDAFLSGTSVTAAQVHQSADNGFVEMLPRARRKEPGADGEPPRPLHKPIVKLTPFSEQERRAMLSQDAVDLPVPSAPTATPVSTPTTATARRRSLREQESLERVAHFLEHQIGEDQPQPGCSSWLPTEQFRQDSSEEEEVDNRLTGVEESTPSTSKGQQQQQLLGNLSVVQEPEPARRRSSLRRRREDTGETVVKDEQEETIVVPIETTKKTVRICSVDEEIRIESFDSAEMDEFVSYPEMQEVQLVTAKILTAEELAESIARREESTKTPTKDEAEAISRLSVGLQPPPLKPSASENALTGGRPDDNKISEKNIKPEILMDLSAACDDERKAFEDKLLTSPRQTKRKLSRVSSDTAAYSEQPPPVVKFQLGDEDSRSRTDLTTFGLREMSERWKSDEGQPIKEDQEQEEEVEKKWKSSSDVPRSQGEEEEDPGPVRRWQSESSGLAAPAAARSRPRQRRSLPSDLRRRGSKQLGQPLLAVGTHDHRALVRDALLLKEEPPPERVPDLLVGKENSLHYQYQTLESPASLDDLAETDASSPAPDFETLDYSSTQSLLSTSFKSYSPKREVETQTQGEHKHTQYELEDLASLVDDVYDSKSGSREELEFLIEARFGSPRREAESQTELESKACQCSSEELAGSGEFGPFFRRQKSFGSPRREVEVQTGQDHQYTQCNFEEFGVDHRGLQWKEPLRGDHRRVPEKRVAICATTSSLESSSPGSQSPQRGDTPPAPLIVLVKGGGVTKQIDMTVTHRDKDGNVVWAKHWGPERLVEIYREHQTSLGLSIVGGKVDLQDSSSSSKSQNVSGIFIKNVLPNSPAGRAGGLQIGDRIIEVDGVDLRNSTHERAVKAIQAAGNPVRLLVQSLVHLSPDNEDQDRDGASGGAGFRSGAGGRWQSTRNRTSSPSRKSGSPTGSQEVIQDGRSGMRDMDSAGPSNRRSSMKKSIRKRAPSPPQGGGSQDSAGDEPKKKQPQAAAAPKPANKYSSGESSEEEEDTRDLEGNVYTKAGIEISRRSAAAVKLSKAEQAEDPEEEDEFGYTKKKVQKKYANLKKPVIFVKLDRDRGGLGISLAGHKDRNKMAVFICGLNPNGIAAKSGELKVGDEILEVNGMILQGRCHLNASSMIKTMPFTSYRIVVVRRPGAIDSCAVKQVTHFPTALAGEDYSHLKGVKAIPIKKGTYGLGIMIIEGKHGEVGQGIFVSDIQEGSAAEQAGLNVGDMILSVNADSVMGATYDEATALLKKAEGVVTLTVCNPNQKKVAEDEAKRARGEKVEEPSKDKKPEKPKDEPQGDPKDCNIRMNKDTIIELAKTKDQPIGFITVGGYDTSLNGVFILDVFKDGAAGKDGRLQPGDRIVEFNKEPLKLVEQEKAYQMIMRVVQGPIHMIIHRDEKAYEEFEVELTKKKDKGSGLVLTGYKSGKGAYVSEVVAGGAAHEGGRIMKGDRVVAVGGTDLREAPVEDIALHVKVSNPVQLKLARYRAK